MFSKDYVLFPIFNQVRAFFVSLITLAICFQFRSVVTLTYTFSLTGTLDYGSGVNPPKNLVILRPKIQEVKRSQQDKRRLATARHRLVDGAKN